MATNNTYLATEKPSMPHNNRRWWVACAVAVAIVLVAPAVVLVVGSLVYIWQTQPERALGQNCERIRVGMSREEVAALFGSPGEEIGADQMPGYPPYAHDPAAPPGWNGVVWGDTFVVWHAGQATVFVGFSNGRVTSKCFLMPSL